MVSRGPRWRNSLTALSDRQDAHSAFASPKPCTAAVHNVAQSKPIPNCEIMTDKVQLHVHVDDITGSSFVCAPELVRGILPRFFGCFEKSTREDSHCAIADPSIAEMHSIYTLNHPFGRGMPLDSDDDHDSVLEPDVWK